MCPRELLCYYYYACVFGATNGISPGKINNNNNTLFTYTWCKYEIIIIKTGLADRVFKWNIFEERITALKHCCLRADDYCAIRTHTTYTHTHTLTHIYTQSLGSLYCILCFDQRYEKTSNRHERFMYRVFFLLLYDIQKKYHIIFIMIFYKCGRSNNKKKNNHFKP